jgi:hypothetical protein
MFGLRKTLEKLFQENKVKMIKNQEEIKDKIFEMNKNQQDIKSEMN